MKRINYCLMILWALLLTACNENNAGQAPDTEFAAYISAYTGGVITHDASIRVDLVNEVPEKDRISTGLFQISPSVKGTVLWTSGNSVSFIPDMDALQTGKKYYVTFNLDRIQKVKDKKLARFKFGFTVTDTHQMLGNSNNKPAGQSQAEGFRVVSAANIVGTDPYIEVVFSAKPVNATTKGMVELEGVSRYYTEQDDNILKIHYEDVRGNITLNVSKGVKDEKGGSLSDNYVRQFIQGDPKPEVKLAINGNILPDDGEFILPFRAVNLKSVEVRIIQIFAGNVLMFLQDNDMGEEDNLRRAGRLIYKGDIQLDRSKDLHQWNNFSVDISKLMKREPGAIYRIRLVFRQDQSLYGGLEPGPALTQIGGGNPTPEDEAEWDRTQPYYWESFYNWEQYKYAERDDPNKPSYYMLSDRFPVVQLLTSDLGLLAKYSGNGNLLVAANDLITAKPASQVQLDVYDFQLQCIAQARTNADGMADIAVPHRPFVVVATQGNSVTYLKVNDGNEKSLSRFDTGGEVIKEGLKAYIYGERGVWRPGDTLHLSMILNSRNEKLPDGHPATLELYTPEGQFHTRMVRQGEGGFYYYDIPTQATDPTGFWNAYIKIGGSSFHKTLNIETVKPNRLKINADYGTKPLQAGSNTRLQLESSWLTGSAASGLKAKAVMTLRRSSSVFKGFEKYSFTAPKAEFNSFEENLFETTLDENGKATVNFKMPTAGHAPGMLNAFIISSVQEDGGDESFTTTTLPFSPFSAYVGVKFPDGDYLETDKQQTISFAVVDANGKRVSGHSLEYRIFKTGWNWWFENMGDNLDSYVGGSSVVKISSGKLVSADRDVTCSFQVNYPEWGRYLVLVRDLESGHVSGQSFIVDWPEYRGRADRRDPENLTMLTFSTDKPSYLAGDKATVYIPAAPGGQALVSIENSTGVLKTAWVATDNQDKPYTFEVTPEMAPNFYIHITLLQPCGNVTNDLPVRLYGAQRVLVEDPDSHLQPVIGMQDVLHPEEEFTVNVTEKDGKPMTYTLAIVDEGLLDLTNFRTPDPWKAMNAIEALGVRTWDMYDQVIGRITGQFTKLAAIGGDQDNIVSARKDNRFNPVVYCLPPQKLKAGGKATHKIKLPMYVGSVRVMVVAGNDKAFGSTDKTVPVNAPLMVVSTLPRRLAPGEEIEMPVNVFAMEDNVRQADIKVEVSGPVTLTGNNTQKITFKGKGDQTIRFALKADAEGTATIRVSASGSGHSASETVSLPIVNPNTERTVVEWAEIEKGKTVNHQAQGGKSYVQLTSFPSFNALKIYKDMMYYPYDCSEQMSSRGLALLHLKSMISPSETQGADQILQRIIKQLYSRQNNDGGFSYWGNDKSDSWVSSMAGLFLVQAQQAGFDVDAAVIQAWRKYQQKMSNAYRAAGSSVLSHLDEAYRLYTLAVSGTPLTAAMNRMREDGKIGYRAGWMLASAYSICGKAQVAEQIINGLDKNFEEYTPYNETYGTSMRDRMIALEALALTGNMRQAMEIALEAVKDDDLSSQEAAFAAIAFDRLRSHAGASSVSANVSGQDVKWQNGSYSMPVQGNVSVNNTSDGTLYASFVDVVRDPAGTEVEASAHGLKLQVSYFDQKGKAFSVGKLKQGDVFQAEIKVSNASTVQGYKNLALSMSIPSGWEIQNQRLVTGDEQQNGYDRMDIRDDRCDWFFSLPAGGSHTFTLKLRAAYQGDFFLPSVVCSSMYEPQIQARTASGTAKVVR